MENKNEKNISIEKLCFGLLIGILFIVVFNIYTLSNLDKKEQPITGNAVKASFANPNIIPKRVPEIYGKELGVSFDDVKSSDKQKADSTIRKLGILDEKITLNGEDLERYISIARKISYEYCCGGESIIFNDGKAACGCSHSFAMRGLAKYLIQNHGSEYTDDAILEELGKWKTLFFPEKISIKAKILQEKGIELNYINLASNKYRGIEEGAAVGLNGGMVGGC